MVAGVMAKGINGQVTLDGAWLTIERTGFGRVGHSKGDKKIRIDQVIGVKMRPAGRMGNGFIAFEMTGRTFSGGLREATQDDNAVVFTRKHQREFDELRAAVEAAAQES